MEIIPHVGFDQIKLGQLKEDALSLIDSQFEEQSETHTDNTNEDTLYFDELGYALTFSSDDDFRLGTITFYSPEFTLFDMKLIGIAEEEFLEEAKKKLTDLELEDDFEDLNSKDYVSDSNGLSFWIQDGLVDSISIFPAYSEDNDAVVWPE